MTDTMVDRVARAYYEHRMKARPFWIPRMGIRVATWDELPDYSKREEVEAILAALAVLREPTDRMIGAVDDLEDSMDRTVSYREAFTAMIDAAIEEARTT